MQFKFSHKCNFGFLKIELFKNSCHSKDFQKPYFCIYILFHNIKVVCLFWHHYCLLAFDWPSFLHGSSHSATCCFGILLTDLQISFCITMWTDIFTNLFKKKPHCTCGQPQSPFQKSPALSAEGSMLGYGCVWCVNKPAWLQNIEGTLLYALKLVYLLTMA